MKNFLMFRKMLSPILIQLLFWAAIILFVYTAVTDFLSHESVFNVLMIIVLGTLAARIVCELLILFFRINDNLEEIKQILAKERLT